MQDAFEIEVMIGSTEDRAEHRRQMDQQAKRYRKGAKFSGKEEVLPYIIRVRRGGSIEELPENAETKKYKILKRTYI